MIVLVIVGVLGVLLAGLSSFGATAEITTTAFGSQAGTVYGAGNGINAAIKAAVNDATWGVAPDATTSGNCPTLSLPAAGTSPAITVQCDYSAGSGFGLTTGGTPDTFVTERPPNSPDYAIVATAASETGITVGANGTVQVGGPIRSNSPLITGSGSISTSIQSILNSGNDGGSPPVPNAITAHGLCTGPATNYVPTCLTNPTDVGTTGSDDYDTNGNWVTGTMPDGADASQYVSSSDISGHCGIAKPLSPGIYQDADALNALINGCSDVVWFKPGVYYFDFRSTTHALLLQNANVHVVGGQLSSTPSTPGSACLTDTTTPAATNGVQWVFGNDSRISVTAGSLDLCPIPTDLAGKQQEISIYGLRHPRTFAASAPATVTAKSAGDVSGSGNFTNESAATTIDGSSATYSWPSSAPRPTGAIQLSGFDLSSLVAAAPPGSTVSADLEVKYASTSRSFSGLTLTLNDGDGSATYSYHGGSPCTNSTTTALCQGSTSATTFDQHFALPGGNAATLAGLASLTAELDANPVNKNGEASDAASLDGMKLTVSYTPPPFRAQSGCVTQAAGCGTAPTFFYADGNNTDINVAGSLYAWDASVSINLPNQIGIAFQRGAVARTFALNAPASGTAQTVIGLPPAQLIKIPGTPGSTIANDRRLTLRANINGPSGPAVVTAVVDIDPTGKVTVLSWNGKPCGPSNCP